MPVRRTSSTRSRDIVIASSDDDIPLVASSRTAARSPAKRKNHVAPNPSELIEIFSSDEETAPRNPTPKDQLKQVQQELRSLKQKYSKLQTVGEELERARKEISELKDASKRSGKVVIDASQFEDHTCCEICTITMWTPYILSGCGHTFCMKCLVEWFSTCLAQHMTAHPAWRPPNGQPLYHRLDPRIRAHPYIAAMAAHQGPQPEFSCPTCRAVVTTKPMEDYSLKAIIHAVATSAGETSPKKDPVVTKRKGKGKAKAVVVNGPFDAFFGKEG
ncbi:hypothetical protein C8F04DRAFT_1087465 [Mycena alexandri]|uniref:RING-type domain-containing protein n=1 Tax=Mycena alexandri TaxID=1745969 RepID=A0AAD6T4B7_9AGAR|nr:hypothetical protein C8F04DRAFT_1087465 [Mycena alexandri]